MSYVVMVTGGRDYGDWRRVQEILDGLKPRPTLLIHGGASGADTLANHWAVLNGVARKVFVADWAAHGRRAGPVRNRQMVDYGPHLVVAFPGGAGTRDAVSAARAVRIPILEVPPR